MSKLSGILVVILTIFFPTLGVFAVAGFGVDVLINVALTILGYIPGHIHTFYIEYRYYERKDAARQNMLLTGVPPAKGIWSPRVQSGGRLPGGRLSGTTIN